MVVSQLRILLMDLPPPLPSDLAGEALKHPQWQFLTWGGVVRPPRSEEMNPGYQEGT